MRKKYIIITPNITKVGGAQIYTRNKKIFLEENGWEVDVFSFKQGKVLIKELADFKDNVIDEIEVSPLWYLKSGREKIYKKVIKNNDYDEIIIESHTETLALWGEFIAKIVSAKHIVFLLSETFKPLVESDYKFFNFKHKRREIAGISNKSLEIFFNEKKKISKEEKYFLNAVCTNVVEDVDSEIIYSIKKEDINIGCITRLEKNYVNGLVDEVIFFCNNNKDKKVKLIVIGSSEDKEIEQKIKDKVEKISNLELVITGFMFPIPKRIFELMDVFIGVSGSAVVSASEGALTISLDVTDGKPIGVLGYNTNEIFYRNSESTDSISELLDKVLIKKCFHKEDLGIFQKKEFINFREEFINHLKFIENSDENKFYISYKDVKLRNKDILKKFIFSIVGVKRYKKLISWYSKILGL